MFQDVICTFIGAFVVTMVIVLTLMWVQFWCWVLPHRWNEGAIIAGAVTPALLAASWVVGKAICEYHIWLP